MNRLTISLLFLSICWMAGCTPNWYRFGRSTQDTLHQVTVSLEALEEKVSQGNPILLRFSLTNQGSQPVRICRWHSPLEGRFSTDYLMVFRRKKPIHYTGSRVRPQSILKDFVTLLPGETLSTTVDIHPAYAFHQNGKYEIKFRGDQVNRLPDSQAVTIKVK